MCRNSLSQAQGCGYVQYLLLFPTAAQGHAAFLLFLLAYGMPPPLDLQWDRV